MEVGRASGYVVAFVAGVVATVLVERIYKYLEDKVASAARRVRRGRRLKALGRDRTLLTYGDEALFVVQFVPGGWAKELVQLRQVDGYDPIRELRKADPAMLPLPAEELCRLILAERERLDTDEARAEGRWNGESLAVVGLTTQDRDGGTEEPILRMRVARSDYATAQVVTREWQRRFDATRTSLPVDGDTFLKPIPGMLNAIGLNATLITSDGYLLLTERSVHAAGDRRGRHISVNEGMLATDRDGGRLDPYVGLARGASEELGIPGIPLDRITLHTAMYDVRRYQLGLLGHIDLRGTPDVGGQFTVERILKRYAAGQMKDKFENRSLHEFSWNVKTVDGLVREPDWIAHGRLNLVMSAIHDFGPHAEYLIDFLNEKN